MLGMGLGCVDRVGSLVYIVWVAVVMAAVYYVGEGSCLLHGVEVFFFF